jgi:TolA-binding protein
MGVDDRRPDDTSRQIDRRADTFDKAVDPRSAERVERAERVVRTEPGGSTAPDARTARVETNEPTSAIAGAKENAGGEVNAAPTTTSTSTSLTLEVARLDRAKSAVAAGQGAVALQELDAYAREFPTGSLRGEATLLRVDALLLAGDRAGAAALAKALVVAAPQSPLAPRLRGIAGMSNP